MKQDLLRRYGLFDARVPRYTSYPTAPHFTQDVGPSHFAAWLMDVPEGARISLYVHVPFCRRLCWFCACRTQGTRTDGPIRRYLDVLKAEIQQVAALLPPDVTIGRLHWGGGTPTILPAEMIAELGATLRSNFTIAADAEVSVEIDPTCVDADRIAALHDLGLTRASIGVQDFDPTVQDAIGRQQSFAQTQSVVENLRRVGVKNLNFDLLYGLPFQTEERLEATVQQVLDLAPDRIALYGYAHVPWVAKRQVLIPAEHLPDGPARLTLFDQAAKTLATGGYDQIGIDHFARAGDGLHMARQNQTLRRNFQGYTDDDCAWLIGLGASSVSRMPQGYTQNNPSTSEWQKGVLDGRLTTVRGHKFTAEDVMIAAMIEELLCQFRITPARIAARTHAKLHAIESTMSSLLDRFPQIVERDANGVFIAEDAHVLARIVAAALDQYNTAETRYSRAV
ncbi:oxygen-independent coproporphyrinogen III oxidase [Monaibacterium marinum]|nr:oxygen-independent coproporphyrinogen III oxidase [Monaibacterium marinum]